MSILAGVGVGVVLGHLGARWQIRRSLAKAHAAERRARAAERLAELGATTGGLAHEIKNPLSTIGLNAQLLAEGLDDVPGDRPIAPEERQRLVRRLTSLRREIERLRGILTDFLTYAGELRLDQHPADLNLLVDELADFFQPQAQQQGVQLRLDLAPGELMAKLDAGLVKQAVLNGLLNAVQAMANNTNAGTPRELILKTTRATDTGVGAAVELRVIDTGPGIAADVLPQIFTPYFTTKSGGSGLGLPTTKRIVEAHHGRLDVHSEVGRGTVLTMSFPAITGAG